MKKKIDVVIAGGAGYTGGELIRLLLHHPFVNVAAVLSQSQEGMKVCSVHRDLEGETDLLFAGKLPRTVIDVLFLCLGHDRACAFLQENNTENVRHIVDLSQDFRHQGNEVIGDRRFIYGLPEICKDPVTYTGCLQSAGNVANRDVCHRHTTALIPRCGKAACRRYPRTRHNRCNRRRCPVIATSHFPYRDNNLAVYKAFTHQHVREIRETLSKSMGNEIPSLHFIPLRGNYPRGILASVYTPCLMDQKQAGELYREYYRAHPFVHVSEQEISMKEVVNTNKCKLHIEKHGHMLHIVSILDNLLKGASGTAIHNMNLLTGLPQMAGLQLKPTVF